MCLSLVGFVPLVGSGIAATAKWGSKAFKASKIGSKVIGAGSKVLDFGKTIGRGIARGVSTGSDYVKRVIKSNADGISRLTNTTSRKYTNKFGQISKFGHLSAWTLGETDKMGNIIIKSGIKGDLFKEVYKHESVHRFLTPKSGLFVRLRQNLGIEAYSRSSLVRYLEEATAETIGSGSLKTGLAFPIKNGYVKASNVIKEGIVYIGAVAVSMYCGYNWAEAQFKGEGK